MKSRAKYKSLVPSNEASGMGEGAEDDEWSLPVAWRNGDLTPDGIGRCHKRLLPDVQELETDLGCVEKSVRDYLEAVNNQSRAGSALSSTFAKLLHDTTLSKISQRYQHVTEQLENSAYEFSVSITSCVMSILCDFTSTLPGIKCEIAAYKQCKNHYEKRREALESFAGKDASASEGKRFQLAKERFHTADKEFTRQQEELSECLSSLEENRVKMLGASLLSLLHTVSQFSGTSSSMLAPLGEYQTVGDYLRDREIGAHLQEATAAWCSIAQGHQAVRDSEYLSAEEIYHILEHKKGRALELSTKQDLAKHLNIILENYKQEVEDIDNGAVVVPGGFSKNPAAIALALKGCCSQLETLAPCGLQEPGTCEELIALLKEEIPKVQLAVGSVGKPWCKVTNLRDSDELESRQKYIQDLVEPLAKQFDIPFTKESLGSFCLTVLNEACSPKTILSSKIAVQLMYGKADLVVVALSPKSCKLRQVRVNCKETNISIEVQLTWWITADQTLFSDILDEDTSDPLFEVNTTYSTVVDYMDYLEEKETTLPSITVEFCPLSKCCLDQDGDEGTAEIACNDSFPVPPPRAKHYARKIAERRQKTAMTSSSVGSAEDKRSCESGKGNTRKWFSASAKLPSMERAFCGATSNLSLASESELSEVINFLSGCPRVVTDANDGDTESVCSFKAMSDSGIESVKNAKLVGGRGGNGELNGGGDGQTKGRKGKKKDKKGTGKTENNGTKKKKKKRGDKAKKDKKKAAEEQGGGEDKKEGGEGERVEGGDGEEKGSTQGAGGTLTRATQDQQDNDGQNVKISESLRSVWEPVGEDGHQSDSPLLTNLTKQSTLSASLDSIYHSCWSLSGLGTEEETKSVKLPSESDRGLNPASVNIAARPPWSKGFEKDQQTATSIWSNASSGFDNHQRKELWPPSLTRQDGIDCEDKEPTPSVAAGESVFSLGLNVTGLELFAAAKQARLSNDSRGMVNDERSDRLSSLIGNRNTTAQSPMWPHEKPTAGQFAAEKSNSCGDGLHRHHVYPHERGLHSHHSDPFLAKNVPWNPSVPHPMYMKVRYDPRAAMMAPFPVEDLGPRPYGGALPVRTAHLRHSHGQPANYPMPAAPEQRRNMTNFYGPR